MELEGTKRISKGAVALFSGTFISRLSGLGRDVSMAFCFGSHPAIAAFMVAYRFSHLFRRIIGEGTLSSGFISHFEWLRKESSKDAALFFRDLFFSLLFFLVGLVLALSVGVWGWMEFGFLSADTRQVLSLTLLMIPGLIFICLYALSSALLQCERKFFLSGIAPVLFNISWIITVFFFRKEIPSTAVNALSAAVVFGFFLQWVLLVPSIKQYVRTFLSWREIWSFRCFSKEVKALLKPLLFSLIGVSATQINSFFDAIFARYASLEGPAYLWYAIRIQQLPLALFGIALSSALLPPLVQAVSRNSLDEFRKLLRFSLTKSFHFIFPCSIALFVLAAPGVNLLYGRGIFDFEATSQTVVCLWGYGIGLLPYVFVLLLAPAFYAQKDFRLPMWAAVTSVICNISLNALFVFVFCWGAVSIAIATSLSAWFNFYFLSKALGQKGLFESSPFKGGICAIIAGGITLFIGHVVLEDPTWRLLLGQSSLSFVRDFKLQAAHFFTLSGVFTASFIGGAWLLNVEEILSILRISRRKKGYIE